MTNNKQSSVEWLCERLAFKLGMPMAITFYIDHAEEIEHAKKMHQEEIEETARTYFHERRKLTPTQYYKEAFGGEK